MSDMVWLLGIELVVVLGLCTLAWIVTAWRKRRRRTLELESLLDALEAAAPGRCEHYCRWLKAHCGADEEKALLAANAWLEAERGFWRHFITWRLEPEPGGPAPLAARLHRFIDTGLEALEPLLQPAGEPAEAATENKEMEDPDLTDAATVAEDPDPTDMPDQPDDPQQPGAEDTGAVPDGGTEASPDDPVAQGTESLEEAEEDIVILSDRSGEAPSNDTGGQDTAKPAEPDAQSPAASQ